MLFSLLTPLRAASTLWPQLSPEREWKKSQLDSILEGVLFFPFLVASSIYSTSSRILAVGWLQLRHRFFYSRYSESLSPIINHQTISMSDELPSFLGVTPFGVYCKTCKNQSLSIQRGILLHSKEFHRDESEFKNTTVVREVHRQMRILQKLHANDLSTFLTDQPSPHPMWFCTGCFSAFNKSCNYHRHLGVRNNSSCVGAFGGKMSCYITICHRVGPKTCNP